MLGQIQNCRWFDEAQAFFLGGHRGFWASRRGSSTRNPSGPMEAESATCGRGGSSPEQAFRCAGWEFQI